MSAKASHSHAALAQEVIDLRIAMEAANERARQIANVLNVDFERLDTMSPKEVKDSLGWCREESFKLIYLTRAQ